MIDDAIVKAHGIHKSYRNVTVLDGIDLRVRKGTVFALLGPNGAGKTTLVRILSTLIRPDGGTATIAGHDVLRAPEKVRAAISLTGQYAAVDELLTGEENLLMMGRLCRLSRSATRRRAGELLDQFDLTPARSRLVKTYSGGMRRRLDLAVSLLGRPSVIFLDEPTTGLDPRSRQAMWDQVRELVAAEVTVFLTTQYLEEADQLADRITMIDDGRVIAEGTAEALKSQLASERVELLLGTGDDFERARRDLDGQTIGVDRELRTVSVTTDGSAEQVRRLLDRMAGQNIVVDRISTHRPSLDDVFLALTGRTERAENR
ncbi:daunorubicin resistance protein DrrA family ABC transporter ATP-binding protein [Micromonospora polyrhachis]|uniref:ABC-2 type transport system ATP-binding protein n=1 Tax=Micromonospora polyrhachis TaxID=1282883 RepID=A0A7W7WNG1_9ACTN|nr:ATP-binding cassette domain-containing protein [Micromonospora polyrhachis]MBB4957815.1 ABC-2 type transport system ATP-binding protein [Micromonospora polyrhachis]